MFKFVLFCCALLLSGLGAQAQADTQSFIKIAHLGTQGRPILDLFMATQEPALNAELGIDGRFKFQNVCLLTEAEFKPLLQYATNYTAKNKGASKNSEYGTFEITLGPAASAQKFIYAKAKSLAFIEGAMQVLQKQAAGTDKSEALRRLEVTEHRVSAGK
jgi:hypothetical protein